MASGIQGTAYLIPTETFCRQAADVLVSFIMMKILKKHKAIFICIALVLITISLFLYFHHRSKLLLTIFPPEDLYDPINVSINLDKPSENIRLNVHHKYAGFYLYGVLIESMPNYGEPNFGKAVGTESIINISIAYEGKTIFTKQHSSWANGSSGLYSEHTGFILGHYRVPSDLPRNVPLELNIQVTNGDETFYKNYGNTTFYTRYTPAL